MIQHLNITPPANGDHRKRWAESRAALEQQDYLDWRRGTNGYWRYRIKHEAIMVFGALLKATGFFRHGHRNARDIRVRQITLSPPGLPDLFKGYRILHLSDLHLDSMEGLGDLIAAGIAPLSCDLCAVTGDFRYARHGEYRQVLPSLRQVVRAIHAEDGIYAVLGNHDTHLMCADIEQEGITLLTNQTTTLSRGMEHIRVIGVDDPHDYYTDAAEICLKHAGDGFKVLLVHSPEIYRMAAASGIGLYLCGHSHGGQICLPGGKPLMTYLDTGKRFYKGVWRYRGMIGHTSPGLGTTKIPIRFNCRPEITVLTLT